MIVQILGNITVILVALSFFVIGIAVIGCEELPRLIAILLGATILALDLYGVAVVIGG